ncbi:Enamine deaminase RidA, house cleaning of reactive enamine intermediates, YjgF/YER057c/UK114 family [Celeribacter baekdonensis]|uniref:Enamine deaminase RidA, house cleaning of reactive enamine intermediates, YjgF/YER057c/UK114 family n=1 Tax=Celeribacter baekdonensis TaxID=875171 RepID=A0A1G7SIL3_9RHOB|nr:Rid family hydrolase [Celeribacter baekdonensis]SDG22907.1 Enamine deaminase RidA, house cleaning of reactive enamine intermediates, YjgF/YER057c/UK114 family [Celeribacter baekdonensis]
MTEIVKLKTGSRFEEHGSYSRLVAVDNLIFVSNTAGRNPRTKLIPEDLTEQTQQVLANIERALSAVGSCLEDVVSARVYVQFTKDIDTIMTAYGERMRGINPTLTMTCPPLGSTEYKVEIDVTAYRGASKVEVRDILLTDAQ